MFNKISKRIVGIVALVGIVSAASAITYSIAGRNGNAGSDEIGQKVESSIVQREASLAGADYISNIDLIIENSNKEQDAEMFNIVEIVPKAEGVTQSDLFTYVNNGSFKSYVIDEYSETDPKGVMAEDMISYNCIAVDANTSLEQSCYKDLLAHAPVVSEINNTTELTTGISGTQTLRALLSVADLIYVNSPSYTAYTGVMNEDVYNYLYNHVLADNKAMILDYVTKTSDNNSNNNNNNNNSTAKTYADLAKLVSNNNIRYRTFGWDLTKTSAEEFFSSQNGSSYLKFNTNRNTATGKVLVVRNAENENSVSAKMQGYSDFISAAYYGNTRPEEMTYTYVTAENLTVTMLEDTYDFIVLEDDISTISISTSTDNNVYKKLKSLSEASRYIIYDSAMLDKVSSGSENGSSGSSNENVVDTSENKYLLLMDSLVTKKGMARYSHVLPITNGFFTSLCEAGENGKESAKSITDIINGQNYRDSGTSGKNGKIYRVLELQPCYPIDLELALAEGRTNENVVNDGQQWGLTGNYYESPYEVMSGVTKEEIEEGTEYYAFELSKAKIAHALGLKMDQIQLDQMSTNTLISKKDVLLETYDLIYIGGNTSAIMPAEFRSYQITKGQWKDNMANALAANTCFEMYTHTGTLVPLPTSQTAAGLLTGDLTPYGTIYIDGTKQKTSVALNGNDLTKVKYQEMLNYLNANMPIVVEKTLASAFVDAYNCENAVARLQLNDIDPNSFMYKFLSEAYNDGNPRSSVKWNVDMVSEAAHQVINNADENGDRVYGNTIGNTVTVFSEATEQTMKTLVTNATTRPSLTIVSQPYDYEENNANTYNTGSALTVKCYATPTNNVTSATYTMKLYVDIDGNGTYSANELQDTKTFTYSGQDRENITPVTLTYKLPSNEYGMKPWKVIAEDAGVTDAKIISMANGYPYFERGKKEKKTVKILQIMPGTDLEAANTDEDYGRNDGHTLYLCPECQQAEHRATYNLTENGDIPGQDSYGHVQNAADEFQLGYHEHTFGMSKYDSTMNNSEHEDWEINYAMTDIVANDYEIDLDILYSYEVDAIVEQTIKNLSESNDETTTTNVAEGSQAYYKGKLTIAQESLETAKNALATSGTEKKLIAAIETMRDNATTYKMQDKFDNFIKSKQYYKVYYYNNDGNSGSGNNLYGNNGNDDDYQKYLTALKKYQEYQDKVVLATKEVEEYSRLSQDGYEWLANNYSVVVLGFAEDFGGKDLSEDACKQIVEYVSNGGSLINTHDSTSRYSNAGAKNITYYMREMFGMDRYSIKDNATTNYVDNVNDTIMYYLSDTSDTTNKYQTYLTTDAKYFWTENRKDTAKWNEVMNSYWATGYLSPVGLTDSAMINNTIEQNTSPYKYALLQNNLTIKYNIGYTIDGGIDGQGVNGAEQVNKGIVTEYPFKIASELHIAGTHAQTYALDMENTDLTVWYTLAPGTSNQPQVLSSVYAASPQDGMNSYYLYSNEYGNGSVFYCGAGHLVVTGPERDNNDERRLFINTILRSAKPGALLAETAPPDINLYNKEPERSEVKEEDGVGKLIKETITNDDDTETTNYIYKVESDTECPEFDFEVIVNSDAANLSKVWVYYDLDYGINGNTSDDYSDDDNHKLIVSYNTTVDGPTLTSGALAKLRSDLENLPLKEEYFTNYGDFTYIVIKATDSAGEVSYQRIRIDLIRALFELTWNSSTTNQVGIDFTNRVKFEI